MTYTYLASPYTDPDSEVQQSRFEAAAEAAANLMIDGECVFCPIAHSHPIALAMIDAVGTEGSADFWKQMDAPFLAGASKMKVLKLPGWDKSSGIKHEIDFAISHNIDVEYIDP